MKPPSKMDARVAALEIEVERLRERLDAIDQADEKKRRDATRELAALRRAGREAGIELR